MFILLFIGISRKNSIADDVSNKEIDSSHIVMFSSLYLLLTLMLLPYRLLACSLRRNDAWPLFLQYQKAVGKLQSNTLRLKYINECLKADIVPRFLKFRVPNNGCFDDKSVHDFQIK